MVCTAQIDEEYWVDTCEALGADASVGLTVDDLCELYCGEGAWADGLEMDYMTIFGQMPGLQENADASMDLISQTKIEMAEERIAEDAEEERCGVPAGLAAFCAGVAESNLQTLTLRECALPPKAVVALAAAIAAQAVPTLTALCLDGNRAGASGAAALANALSSGGAPALRTLSLAMNAIGDEGGISLGTVLQAGTPGLTDLDVSKNQLEVGAFRSFLVKADQTGGGGGNQGQNAGLQRLNLFGNRVGAIPEPFQTHFRAMFQSHIPVVLRSGFGNMSLF